MRKLLRILFLVQLPILIGMLAVTVFDNAIGVPTASLDQTSSQEQFLHNATNRTAYLVNERVNAGAISLFSKTKDHSFPVWFAGRETREHLLYVRFVEYIEAVVLIHRFCSTDIIYPFHSFL